MSTSISHSAAAMAAVAVRLRAAGCVFAEHEAELLAGAAPTSEELDDLVSRRVRGEPLEHVVGWAEFCGLRVGVTRGVFVPRRRTEFLASQAALLVREAALAGHGAIVVDLACGSGAIGLAAVTMAGTAGVQLHAADIVPAAVDCARGNLRAVGGRAYLGDLYEALPAGLSGRVDVLVANVPYVPSGQVEFLPPEARVHEPLLALDGGSDGLDVLRRVVAQAGGWLRPGGRVLLETSAGQAPAALAALSAAGLEPAMAADEELGATVVIGTHAHVPGRT